MGSQSVNFVILFCLVSVEGYNVLFLSAVPSPSHRRLGEGFVKPLLHRGHKVTYVTPFASETTHENFTQINIGAIMQFVPGEILNVSQHINKAEKNVLQEWINLISDLAYYSTLLDEVQDLMSDVDQAFDVVVVDWLGTEVLSGFSALFQCPLIYLSAFDAFPTLLSLVDDIPNPSYSETIMTTFPKPFTFIRRVQMLWELFSDLWHLESLKPKYSSAYHKAFSAAATIRGVTLPPFESVMYNASLIFLNSHPSYSSSLRLPQNVKSIGGYYIEDSPPPLPKDIQTIMDEAKHGVIYFSLGTNAQSKDIPGKVKIELINMFREFNQTVLWKFEEDFEHNSQNIFMRKWMPQSSILVHPNLRLFITHGGLLSKTEVIHYGVPTIGVPVFGDQFANVKRSVEQGHSIRVPLSNNMAQDLRVAIIEMLRNPSYTQKARLISSLYHDRPQTATQELIYWLEHVVRTRGAPHLKSDSLLLRWHQRLYIDLLVLVVIVLVMIVFLLHYTFSFYQYEKLKTQ